MSKTKREQSSIDVNVVDMDIVEENMMDKHGDKIIDKLNSEHDSEVVGIRINTTVGFVGINDNIYALTNEGVGLEEPITDDNKFTVDIYPEFEGNSVSMIPSMQLQWNDEDFEKLPIEKTEKLHDFIREFGNRLEQNYQSWKTLLEEKQS